MLFKEKTFSLILVLLFVINFAAAFNKYSESANKQKVSFSQESNIKALRELDKPFRMHKLNLLWTKAKHRLTDVKLQSLLSDLKIHDKEEIEYKHAKSDGKDNSGLEEARLRKKLLNIMSSYGLMEHFDETVDPNLYKPYKHKDATNYVAKDLFKDKRLNNMWAKAERAGFTHDELEALKEEFNHHQDKVEEYMNLLNEVESGDKDHHENSLHEKPQSWNEIEREEELSNDVPGKKIDYLSKSNMLKEKRFDVKNGYEHLERVTAQGSNRKEFVEPKVQGLWKIAIAANFTTDELDSLKEELMHYETRLLKIRHLHTEAALEAVRKGKTSEPIQSKDEHIIKKQIKHAQKLHMDLEAKIMQKHVEL